VNRLPLERERSWYAPSTRATFAVWVVASAGASTADAGNQLAGTWTVTVNRSAPLPPLTSLQVFTSDGSVIEMANEWQATRTANYGRSGGSGNPLPPPLL